MLRAGWVVTYEQAGAEYGKWSKDEFLRLQAEAQAAKKGMWKYGMSGETPAEYKRRYAGSADAAETGKTIAAKKNAQVQTGWLKGLWRKLAGTKQ
ncbi:hypothetical protein EW026_g5880 [Hermanssonia centrifuga]|uniref:TNase-like domain-containing protein n=1 Tax=Hermanssonia centrifuga TaxID=98765 RepID=A0A4S4KCQ3_9APHY|nr:hypothetical protein EW026_g5880 [Hermanssonia centrifuga]